MKRLHKKRRIQVLLVAGVAIAVSTAMIGYAMRDGINFFLSPTQVVAETPSETERFRLGGLVEEGSIIRGQGDTVRFRVTDGGATIPVSYRGVLPDLFSENEGMVGTGRFVDGVFQASEILAKHDETYMPREVMEALKAQGEWHGPDPESLPEPQS